MEKLKLVKRGVYLKLADEVSSPDNATKNKCKELQGQIQQLKELKGAKKFVVKENIRSGLRMSVLARAFENNDNIIMSTPHHTKNIPNELRFFGSNDSDLLSPINTGDSEQKAESNEKNNEQDISGSSSEILSEGIAKKNNNSSVIYVGIDNSQKIENKEVPRKSRKEHDKNRNKVRNKLGFSSEKGSQILSDTNPVRDKLHRESVQEPLSRSRSRGFTKKSRIPVRAGSQDVERDPGNIPEEQARQVSRSKSESPDKSSVKQRRNNLKRTEKLEGVSIKTSCQNSTPIKELASTINGKSIINPNESERVHLRRSNRTLSAKRRTDMSHENSCNERTVSQPSTRTIITRSCSRHNEDDSGVPESKIENANTAELLKQDGESSKKSRPIGRDQSVREANNGQVKSAKLQQKRKSDSQHVEDTAHKERSLKEDSVVLGKHQNGEIQSPDLRIAAEKSSRIVEPDLTSKTKDKSRHEPPDANEDAEEDEEMNVTLTNKMDRLIAEISARKRALTTNTAIQTSLTAFRKKKKRPGVRSVGLSSNVDNENSTTTSNSSSAHMDSDSTSGAASDIMNAAYDNSFARPTRITSRMAHNIFQSLEEGDELDNFNFSESDVFGLSDLEIDQTISVGPWRYVNNGTIHDEANNSFDLNYTCKENALTLDEGRTGFRNSIGSDNVSLQSLNMGNFKTPLLRRSMNRTRKGHNPSTRRTKTYSKKVPPVPEFHAINDVPVGRSHENSATDGDTEDSARQHATTGERSKRCSVSRTLPGSRKNRSPVKKNTDSAAYVSLRPSDKELLGVSQLPDVNSDELDVLNVEDGEFANKNRDVEKTPMAVNQSYSKNKDCGKNATPRPIVAERTSPNGEERRRNASVRLLNATPLPIVSERTSPNGEERGRNASVRLLKATPHPVAFERTSPNSQERRRNVSVRLLYASPVSERTSPNSKECRRNQSVRMLNATATTVSEKRTPKKNEINSVHSFQKRNELHAQPLNFNRISGSSEDVLDDNDINKRTQTRDIVPRGEKSRRNAVGEISRLEKHGIKQSNIIDNGNERPKRNRRRMKYLTDIVLDVEMYSDKQSEPKKRNTEMKKNKRDTSRPSKNVQSKKTKKQTSHTESDSTQKKGNVVDLPDDILSIVQDQDVEPIQIQEENGIEVFEHNLEQQVHRPENHEDFMIGEGEVSTLKNPRAQDENNTDSTFMPPPTINSISRARLHQKHNSDSGFDSTANIPQENWRMKRVSKTRSKTRKTREANISESKTDQNTIGNTSKMEDYLTNVRTGSVTKHPKRSNVAKDVTAKISRTLERQSSISGSIDGSSSRQNQDSAGDFSQFVNSDFINCVVDGGCYSFKFANRVPSDEEYKRLGNIDVTQTKHPSDQFGNGFVRLHPGDQKRPTVTTKYSFVYSVVSGAAWAQCQKAANTFKQGDFFVIPVGHEYSIRNIDTKSDLILSYTRFKTPS